MQETIMSGNRYPSTPKNQSRIVSEIGHHQGHRHGDINNLDLSFKTPRLTLPSLDSPPKLLRKRSNSVNTGAINLDHIPPFMLPTFDSLPPCLSDDEDDQEIIRANFRLQPRPALNSRFSFRPQMTASYEGAGHVAKKRRVMFIPPI